MAPCTSSTRSSSPRAESSRVSLGSPNRQTPTLVPPRAASPGVQSASRSSLRLALCRVSGVESPHSSLIGRTSDGDQEIVATIEMNCHTITAPPNRRRQGFTPRTISSAPQKSQSPWIAHPATSCAVESSVRVNRTSEATAMLHSGQFGNWAIVMSPVCRFSNHQRREPVVTAPFSQLILPSV